MSLCWSLTGSAASLRVRTCVVGLQAGVDVNIKSAEDVGCHLSLMCSTDSDARVAGGLPKRWLTDYLAGGGVYVTQLVLLCSSVS